MLVQCIQSVICICTMCTLLTGPTDDAACVSVSIFIRILIKFHLVEWRDKQRKLPSEFLDE